MVDLPATFFLSGAIAVLHLCKDVYLRCQDVKRFREDCHKLAHFVQRIEGFIVETESDADMTAPGWQQAFSALHEVLHEVIDVFEKCASSGLIRSFINADTLNMQLSAIAQRLMLALQLIPLQKAKAADKRLSELLDIQAEIRGASFAAVRAAEEQSAQLKRLMDQSRVDATKTQEMLAQDRRTVAPMLLKIVSGCCENRTVDAHIRQERYHKQQDKQNQRKDVLQLLQADPTVCAESVAASGPGPGSGGQGGASSTILRVDPEQLEQEVADLQEECMRAAQNKNAIEEEYLKQIIAAIGAMEARLHEDLEVPADLRCPITYQLLRDPVVLADSGHTYEREAIQEWLDRGNMKDPLSGIQLQSRQLVPNIFARKQVDDWLQNHPQYTQQQAEAAAAAPTATAGFISVQSAKHSPVAVDTKAAVAAAAVAHSHKIQIEHHQKLDSRQLGPMLSEDSCQSASLVEIPTINPKTAAILAAEVTQRSFEGKEKASGSSSCSSPSKQQNGSFFSLPQAQDEKKAAQLAYAASVGAAAAASDDQGQAVTVAAAVRAPVGYASAAPDVPLEALQPDRTHQQLGCSTDGATAPPAATQGKGSSMQPELAAAAAAAAQARADLQQQQQRQREFQQQQRQLASPPAAAQARADLQQQQQLQQQHQQQQEFQQQQQQQPASPPAAAAAAAAAGSSGSSRQLTAAADTAGTSASSQAGLSLTQLHATLGRAADGRQAIMQQRMGSTTGRQQQRGNGVDAAARFRTSSVIFQPGRQQATGSECEFDTRSTVSEPVRGSKGSSSRGWLGLGKSRKDKGLDRDSLFDDAASTTSSDSRRSVTQGMKSVFDKLKYTMVYNDDKC